MYSRFLSLLNENNVTPYRVSKEAKVSQSVLSAWKNGSTPRPLTMRAIADYFGVNVEWLSGQTDVRENRKPADHKISGLDAAGYGMLNAENRALIDSMIEKLLKSQSGE